MLQSISMIIANVVEMTGAMAYDYLMTIPGVLFVAIAVVLSMAVVLVIVIDIILKILFKPFVIVVRIIPFIHRFIVVLVTVELEQPPCPLSN